jgi:hypothetical protein
VKIKKNKEYTTQVYHIGVKRNRTNEKVYFVLVMKKLTVESSKHSFSVENIEWIAVVVFIRSL